LKKVTKNPLFYPKKLGKKIYLPYGTQPQGYTYPIVPSAKTLAKKSIGLPPPIRKSTNSPIVPYVRTFSTSLLTKSGVINRIFTLFSTERKLFSSRKMPKMTTFTLKILPKHAE